MAETVPTGALVDQGELGLLNELTTHSSFLLYNWGKILDAYKKIQQVGLWRSYNTEPSQSRKLEYHTLKNLKIPV